MEISCFQNNIGIIFFGAFSRVRMILFEEEHNTDDACVNSLT